jgi:hypothetical protein
MFLYPDVEVLEDPPGVSYHTTRNGRGVVAELVKKHKR